MTDLNSLLPAGSGWTLDYATAVNDAGEIVGWGTIDGETHAFRLDLSPSVPGPSSLVLCCAGTVTLLCCRWRWHPPQKRQVKAMGMAGGPRGDVGTVLHRARATGAGQEKKVDRGGRPA
jgi:hypothetical protein